MKLRVIFEQGDNELWGQIDLPKILITCVGKDKAELEKELRKFIKNAQSHELKGTEYENINVDEIQFLYSRNFSSFT